MTEAAAEDENIAFAREVLGARVQPRELSDRWLDRLLDLDAGANAMRLALIRSLPEFRVMASTAFGLHSADQGYYMALCVERLRRLGLVAASASALPTQAGAGYEPAARQANATDELRRFWQECLDNGRARMPASRLCDGWVERLACPNDKNAQLLRVMSAGVELGDYARMLSPQDVLMATLIVYMEATAELADRRGLLQERAAVARDDRRPMPSSPAGYRLGRGPAAR